MSEPSIRKPLGVLGILLWIGVWAVLAVWLPAPESRWLQIGWYALMGLIWIAPLGPVLKWMERR